MKSRFKLGSIRAPLPWDLMVFLAVTTLGFGYSLSHFGRPAVALEGRGEEQREISLSTSDAQDVIDLGCLERKLSKSGYASESRSLRIKGQFCNFGRTQMRTFGGIRVKNMTTGYEGTIILRGNEPRFVSDYLSLIPGMNLIRFEWQDSPGTLHRTFIAEVFQR